MNEASTDVIVARSREVDRLSTMIWWSVVAHIAVSGVIMVAPHPKADSAPKTVMTISLGGAPGPRTGGMTQMGARAVQTPQPAEPVKKAETAPAPKTPEMTLPDPRSKPRAQPKNAPKDAASKTPSTGPQPQEGTARAETRVRGQGFGLSSAGGTGGGVTVDAVDFCCNEYIQTMVELVRQNWNNKQGVAGVSTMKFTIGRDGTITGILLEKSSGFTILDNEANRALRLARLPPLPREYPNATLGVHLEFDYGR